MCDNIFISTSCFIDKDLRNIVQICQENNIKCLELSSCDFFNQETWDFLLWHRRHIGFRFLLHNYFPPPTQSFVLNLASNDLEILRKSREHCKKAIDFTKEIGATLYSVHAGFCFHATPKELGNKLNASTLIPKEDATKIFIESIQEIGEYAARRGIKLAIENNVVAPFNLVKGKNKLLLGATAEELLELLNSVSLPNVGLLLDVGHLKVTAATLQFSKDEFIRLIAANILAIHLSDNDGIQDGHMEISYDSWFWPILRSYITSGVPVVLECWNINMERIKFQKELIKTALI